MIFLSIIKAKFFNIGKSESKIIKINIGLFVIFIFVYIINNFSNYYIQNSDLLIIILCILSMDLIRNILKKIILIIFKSKEIICYLLLIIFSYAILGRILFYEYKELKRGEGIYFYFNFETFHNSFYTLLILISLNNFPLSMLYAYRINKIYFLYFASYIFIIGVLILNMLIAIFNYNYQKLYVIYTKKLKKHPKLTMYNN